MTLMLFHADRVEVLFILKATVNRDTLTETGSLEFASLTCGQAAHSGAFGKYKRVLARVLCSINARPIMFDYKCPNAHRMLGILENLELN